MSKTSRTSNTSSKSKAKTSDTPPDNGIAELGPDGELLQLLAEAMKPESGEIAKIQAVRTVIRDSVRGAIEDTLGTRNGEFDVSVKGFSADLTGDTKEQLDRVVAALEALLQKVNGVKWEGFEVELEIDGKVRTITINSMEVPVADKKNEEKNEETTEQNDIKICKLDELESGAFLRVNKKVEERLERGEKHHFLPRFDEGATYVTLGVGAALGVAGTLAAQAIMADEADASNVIDMPAGKRARG